MRIIETTYFTKRLKSLVKDDDYRIFQNELVVNPKKGKVIKGSGGLRKIRFGLKGKGKSGGARVIYYYTQKEEIILLLLIYEKHDLEELTNEQLKILRSIVEEEFK